METIQFWTTVSSPLVGVVAIIVAFIISHHSTKKAQQQINAVYNLLDVFVAAQTPTMIEAKQKYENQLSKLDSLIEEQKEDIQIIRNPFLGQGPLIDIVEESYRKKEQYEQLAALEDKRKEIQGQLSLIQSFFDRTLEIKPVSLHPK